MTGKEAIRSAKDIQAFVDANIARPEDDDERDAINDVMSTIANDMADVLVHHKRSKSGPEQSEFIWATILLAQARTTCELALTDDGKSKWTVTRITANMLLDVFLRPDIGRIRAELRSCEIANSYDGEKPALPGVIIKARGK